MQMGEKVEMERLKEGERALSGVEEMMGARRRKWDEQVIA